MKTVNYIKTFAIAATTTVLFACGGSGGSGTQSGSFQGTVVNGVAQAGMFSVGQAVFIGYSGAGKDKKYTLKTVPFTRIDSGRFSANIGNYAGVLKVEVSGTYTDEATLLPVTVLATAPLKAAVPSTSVTSGMTVVVTPLTDIAVNKASEGGVALTDTSVTNNNKAVSALFGIDDIVKTVPIASDAAALAASVDNKQKAYTAALVTVSQYVAEYAKIITNSASITDVKMTSANQQEVLLAALTQISSGINVNTTAATPVITITAPSVAFKLNQASINAATNTATMGLVNAAGSTVKSAIIAAVNNTISTSDASVKSVKAFKLKITGSYTGKLAGIQAGINIPAGVTIKTDTGGILSSGVIDAAGNDFGTIVLGKVNTGGTILSIDVMNAAGIGIGTFATIYCTAPSTVSSADFSIVSGSKMVAPITGAVIAGLMITIE